MDTTFRFKEILYLYKYYTNCSRNFLLLWSPVIAQNFIEVTINGARGGCCMLNEDLKIKCMYK